MPNRKRSKLSAAGGRAKFTETQIHDTETRKRSRDAITSSGEDSTQALSDLKPMRSLKARANREASTAATKERKSSSTPGDTRAMTDLKRKLKKTEAERKSLEDRFSDKKEALKELRVKFTTQEKALDKAKKDKQKLKRANEKLEKEKQDLKVQHEKDKKKVDNFRSMVNKAEVEKVKLESKLESLRINGEASKQAGVDGASAAAAGGSQDLFQDMMDNFRELAETQLQCAVCNELFVEAVSVDCGHTFCSYCIGEWRKKKNNCPVCRTRIKAANPVKVLDEYSDKLYDQFVSEGGKQARASLKEERAKIKSTAAETAAAGAMRAGAPDLIRVTDSSSSDSSFDSDIFEFRFDLDSNDEQEDIFNASFSDEEFDRRSREVERRIGRARNAQERERDSPVIGRLGRRPRLGAPRVVSPTPSPGPQTFQNIRDILYSGSESDDSDFSIQAWNRTLHRGRRLSSSSSSSSRTSSSSSSDTESDSLPDTE